MVDCRLLLVEPSRLSREGLRSVLHGMKGSIQDVSSVHSFIERDTATCPDVVIWGAGLPFKALHVEVTAIRTRFARVPMPARHLVLASRVNSNVMRQVTRLEVEALLQDDITSEVLLRSIELVMLGQRIFPALHRPQQPLLGAEVVPFPRAQRSLAETPSMRRREVTLSTRENEILRHLIEGVSNKAIAHKLHITEATVKVHVRALFRKIGASNRTQAAIWALHNPFDVVGHANGV